MLFGTSMALMYCWHNKDFAEKIMKKLIFIILASLLKVDSASATCAPLKFSVFSSTENNCQIQVDGGSSCNKKIVELFRAKSAKGPFTSSLGKRALNSSGTTLYQFVPKATKPCYRAFYSGTTAKKSPVQCG